MTRKDFAHYGGAAVFGGALAACGLTVESWKFWVLLVAAVGWAIAKDIATGATP